MIKIAAAAYTPQWHGDWDSLCDKVTSWVVSAAEAGAQLLVFPEYAGIEAALIGTPRERDWCEEMAKAEGRWIDLHRRLAQSHGVYILAGSLAAGTEQSRVNRAVLCGPCGKTASCDKLIPTPYERSTMGINAGPMPFVVDTALGRIGVSICYDSEFPIIARQMVELGAQIILVPSCTDFPAGQTRVRQSCRARAIEGQCLVVQSPLVGDVPECDIVDTNTGRVGIFCPPDHGLPSDGILAQGETDVAGWTYVDVDLAHVTSARSAGQVGNFAHWPEQDRFSASPAQITAFAD